MHHTNHTHTLQQPTQSRIWVHMFYRVNSLPFSSRINYYIMNLHEAVSCNVWTKVTSLNRNYPLAICLFSFRMNERSTPSKDRVWQQSVTLSETWLNNNLYCTVTLYLLFWVEHFIISNCCRLNGVLIFVTFFNSQGFLGLFGWNAVEADAKEVCYTITF